MQEKGRNRIVRKIDREKRRHSGCRGSRLRSRPASWLISCLSWEARPFQFRTILRWVSRAGTANWANIYRLAPRGNWVFPGIARYDRFLPRIAFCFHPSQHLFCFPLSAPGTRAVSDGQLAWWPGFNTDGEEEILVLIGNPKNKPEFCALSKWNTVYPETRQSFLNPTQRRHASRASGDWKKIVASLVLSR